MTAVTSAYLPCSQWNAERLRAKLDMVIHYRELFDLHYRAQGADSEPSGWDMTVQEMVARLKKDQPQGLPTPPTPGPGD